MSIVFVLGAAANIELDRHGAMPIGSQLAERIQNQVSSEFRSGSQFPSGPISDTIASSGGLGSEHVAAMRRIEQGITHVDSIDRFIDEWADQPKLSEVGKLLIAHQILESEAKTDFASALSGGDGGTAAMREIRGSWLGQLFRYANAHVRRRDVADCLSGISFITFNYDRCLEAALYLFVRSQGLNDGDASSLLSKLDIYHAYGSLGPLSEYGSLSKRSEFHWYEILNSSQRIKTFHEEIESEHQLKIRDCINRSEKIVFLGFGYHSQNLELLGINPRKNLRIYGTSYGMRRAERDTTSSFFSEKTLSQVLLPDLQCSSLLDELREEIFSL